MSKLISILFIVLFLLYAVFFINSLIKRGLSFKLGISFGILYFIFIPALMMVSTGELLVSQVDFGNTSIENVILSENIQSSFILILFLVSILSYLYFPEIKGVANEKKNNLNNDYWKLPLILYLALLSFIFIASGVAGGGHWYNSRHEYMVNYGATAVLLLYLVNACKILIIATFISLWSTSSISNKLFFVTIISFVFVDMIITGNRIYAFTTCVIVFLSVFRARMLKATLLFIIGLPIIYLIGYFASIFRHMRGPLLEQGLPSLDHFINVYKSAAMNEPPDVYNFLSGISESVNLNVVYGLLNKYDDFLYGSTYLKTILFPIPRSIWASKPLSITSISGNYFGAPSLATTFIGEIYMNFSYIGILLIPLFLSLTENIMRKFYGASNFTKIILFFLGLMIFRMPFSDTFLIFAFILVLVKLMNYKYKLSAI